VFSFATGDCASLLACRCFRAEIFGGGVNAVSRYENGKTKPPLALVKLLRMLEKHPELIDEVKAS
jgi:HTH-type transcriptional regulator / antitoxin MqsA